ncbi:MAG TPA: PAC2 family protein [Mycobacteriales bacterium]|nr:PAC2 family protein [Mycobacteriales bacterium]
MVAVPPEELFEITGDVSELQGLVLIEALDGFIDAGGARRLTRDHLLGGAEPETVVTFDVDLLHDYRARRPPMTFAADHWESYEPPTLDIRRLTDAAGAPYLLLSGSEPDVMWERFAAAVLLVARRLGVHLTVGTNAIPMAVPHTRPIGLTAHAARHELIADYAPWVGTVQVPGSAGHLLEHRLAEAGFDSMGFAVHVPHYLAQANYPPAAEALVRAIARATGLVLPVGPLEEAAREMQQSIAGLIGQSEELTELVQTLESQYDAAVADRGASLTETASLPTGDELGAELERFLAEQSRKRDEPR